MNTIKKQLKRAFTIVELVIVIAVIAALAAVLIPTFVNVLSSANESVDTSLVKNLNTALASEEILHGDKADSMDIALDWVEDNGYSVEKITPTSNGYDIAWDKTSNRFILMNGDSVVYCDASTEITSLDLWYINTGSELSTDTGKQYCYTTENAFSGSVTVSNSINLSAQTNVTEVVVETKSADVSVVVSNAALVVENEATKEVNVYGTVTTITGSNFGSQSFHIYGTVTGKIEVLKGRVVAESGSSISTIVVTATKSSDVKIEVETSSSVGSIGATNEDVASELSNVVTGASSGTILTETISSDFAGGTGTEASPYLIATAQQLVNIGNLSSEMYNGIAYYFELTDNIDLTGYTSVNTGDYVISSVFHGQLDGNEKTIYVAGNTDTDVVLFYTNIWDAEIKDLTIIQTNSRLVGLFDIINVVADYRSKVGKVILENITFDSNYSGTHTFKYYGSSQFCVRAMYKVDFINCINKVSYKIPSSGSNGAYGGIFIGNYVDNTNYPSDVGDFTWGSTICFIDCINYGYVTGDCVGFFFGNSNQATASVQLVDSSDFENTNLTSAALYINGCANYGTLLGTAKVAPLGGLTSQTKNDENNTVLLSDNTKFVSGTMLVSSVNDMSLSLDDNNKVIINASTDANVASYTVMYGVSLSYSKSGTSYGSFYFSVSQTVYKADVSTTTINFVSKIMMDTTYDTSATDGSKYADIAESGTYLSDQGIEYILVAQNDGSYIAVVNSTSAISIYRDGADITVSCGSTPSYTINSNNSSSTCIGLVAYTITVNTDKTYTLTKKVSES